MEGVRAEAGREEGWERNWLVFGTVHFLSVSFDYSLGTSHFVWYPQFWWRPIQGLFVGMVELALPFLIVRRLWQLWMGLCRPLNLEPERSALPCLPSIKCWAVLDPCQAVLGVHHLHRMWAVFVRRGPKADLSSISWCFRMSIISPSL